jgi:hypothetical protein
MGKFSPDRLRVPSSDVGVKRRSTVLEPSRYLTRFFMRREIHELSRLNQRARTAALKNGERQR